jgi:hypothetical protein
MTAPPRPSPDLPPAGAARLTVATANLCYGGLDPATGVFFDLPTVQP